MGEGSTTVQQPPAERQPPALGDTEDFSQQLFAHANDGLFLVSREGRLVAVNPKLS